MYITQWYPYGAVKCSEVKIDVMTFRDVRVMPNTFSISSTKIKMLIGLLCFMADLYTREFTTSTNIQLINRHNSRIVWWLKPSDDLS